ncbi:hypothetical protein P152DRAFT_472064 [Eremomyces bilateralis CBS 781.70]|uniref:Sulfotransferase n=1 Tax=Eremomyces bilateralis CBS 781.70 TaxID=1392243 RepID=A0A6G1G8S0_9PEZI|nr:uncharacterized protein P152DRAFT_472064 [Eremomyces bilateralis CBS 781.70]KAF1814290.1 hypothetical protein P152DRAFT_472064 [Eremomyces bilateralis CBS 781.70]
MFTALQKLGYRDVYHMFRAIKNTKDFDLWNEAVDAKWYGKGEPYERADWDQLLGDCMAALGFPCAAFAPELIASYPEAKVILTHRNPEA